MDYHFPLWIFSEVQFDNFPRKITAEVCTGSFYHSPILLGYFIPYIQYGGN